MDPLHLHKNKLNNPVNIYLLLIPALVFVLTLALMLRFERKFLANEGEDVSVLGESATQVDNGK